MDSIFSNEIDPNHKFQNQTYQHLINERGFEKTGDILFQNCIFEEFVILENIKCREISFFECKFKKGLYLGEGTFYNISFFGTTSQDIDIVSNTSDYLSLRSLTAREVQINGSYNSVQTISSKIEAYLLNDINTAHTHKESKIEFLSENIISKINIKCSTSFSEIFFKDSSYDAVTFEGEFKKRISFI